MRKPKLAFAIICLAALSCGCAAIREAAGGAQQLTQSFLSAISTGDYVAIREMMSGSLQERFHPPRVESVFSGIREDTGICRAPRIINFHSNVNASGSRLTLGFAADCTLGAIQGTLVWKTEDSARKLESFSIFRLLASSASVSASEAPGDLAQAR